MKVNMEKMKRNEIGNELRVFGKEERKINEIGKKDKIRMVGEGKKIINKKIWEGCLNMSGREEDWKMKENINKSLKRNVEKENDELREKKIGNIMGIEDGSGKKMRKKEEVKLMRSEMWRWDVKMSVDEERKENEERKINLVF